MIRHYSHPGSTLPTSLGCVGMKGDIHFKGFCVARCIHASESGNCTSWGIGTDRCHLSMITRHFNPIQGLHQW